MVTHTLKSWRDRKASLIAAAFVVTLGLAHAIPPAEPEPESSAGWTLTAWNDLGMHCMDEDFAVFAILPPFNTVNAQLIDLNGNRVIGGGNVHLYYQAAEDPDASETHSSAEYTNFWEYAQDLFGSQINADTGLFGSEMPGPNNTPKEMHWNATHQWWTAEGIPIVPLDKWGDSQAYPLIRITARDGAGALLAETLTTTPVSAEMNCITCHGSNTDGAAEPAGGWVNDGDPIRDYRLNILKLHDGMRTDPTEYQDALSAYGYNSSGLYETVVQDGTAVLCATCHASNALGTTGYGDIAPLTEAIHYRHRTALEPGTSLPLGSSINRNSCYLCHPGLQTQCLRGAMGRTTNANGQPKMSCQSCHGGMTDVGANTRTGWFDEPNCQSCHSGTETNNTGKVRYTSSFDDNGDERVPADARFATNPDTPAAGISLYRFSHGHGGLQCSACHGSPHAIYPTSKRNDNLQSLAVQGHVGTISDCASCHQNDTSTTHTTDGGPHGMHGIGQWWVDEHHDVIPEVNDSRDTTACKACHGLGAKGGVLSQALGPRTFQSEKGGTIHYFEGQRVSCYDCHNGPDESDTFNQAKPVVQNLSITTDSDTTVAATLLGSDADSASLSYRLVSLPQNGTIAISGAQVTYTPNPSFIGTDVFTYCARDNRTDSNLGIASISVGSGANTVDSDGDGIADLIERAFGLSTARINRGNAPNYAIYTDPSGNRFIEASYDPKLIPADLSLVFEASGTLAVDSWDSNDANLSRHSNSAGRTVIRLQLPSTGSDRHFLRCRVEQN